MRRCILHQEKLIHIYKVTARGGDPRAVIGSDLRLYSTKQKDQDRSSLSVVSEEPVA